MLRTSLLVIALAACGSDAVRHIADAPPVTTDTPAAGSDASPPSPVTLTVTLAGAGESGLTVYFQSADSTLIATAMTDASGNATGSVGAGGFVTVVNPFPPTAAAASPDRLVTWADVAPGEHLALDAGATPAITVSFVIPLTGLGTYTVSTTCGSVATTITAGVAAPPPTAKVVMTTDAGCIGPQDVLVVKTDGNQQTVGSFFVGNQTFANNGMADYTAQTYTAAIARTYMWNDDNDVATLTMTDVLQSAHGVVYRSAGMTATGSPPSVTHDAPDFGTLQDVVQASVTIGNTQHQLLEWGQSATYATDWGAHRLPDITAAAYDVTAKQVVLTTTGGTVQGSLYEGLLAASRPSDGRTWERFVMSNTAPVQLPALPTTIYDWNIAATDTLSATDAVVFDIPGDPSAARQTVLGPGGLAALETGTAGVLSTAAYVQKPAVVRTRLPFLPR